MKYIRKEDAILAVRDFLKEGKIREAVKLLKENNISDKEFGELKKFYLTGHSKAKDGKDSLIVETAKSLYEQLQKNNSKETAVRLKSLLGRDKNEDIGSNDMDKYSMLIKKVMTRDAYGVNDIVREFEKGNKQKAIKMLAEMEQKYKGDAEVMKTLKSLRNFGDEIAKDSKVKDSKKEVSMKSKDADPKDGRLSKEYAWTCKSSGSGEIAIGPKDTVIKIASIWRKDLETYGIIEVRQANEKEFRQYKIDHPEKVKDALGGINVDVNGNKFFVYYSESLKKMLAEAEPGNPYIIAERKLTSLPIIKLAIKKAYQMKDAAHPYEAMKKLKPRYKDMGELLIDVKNLFPSAFVSNNEIVVYGGSNYSQGNIVLVNGVPKIYMMDYMMDKKTKDAIPYEGCYIEKTDKGYFTTTAIKGKTFPTLELIKKEIKRMKTKDSDFTVKVLFCIRIANRTTSKEHAARKLDEAREIIDYYNSRNYLPNEINSMAKQVDQAELSIGKKFRETKDSDKEILIKALDSLEKIEKRLEKK